MRDVINKFEVGLQIVTGVITMETLGVEWLKLLHLLHNKKWAHNGRLQKIKGLQSLYISTKPELRKLFKG